MSGKTDKRLHARTQAPDFADRWAQTFGVVKPSPQPDANGNWVAVVEATDRAGGELQQALHDMTVRAAGCGHLFPFRCDCGRPPLDAPPDRP